MPRRSLWPREHGAYFQLGIPLACALAARAPSRAAIAWAAASCLAFLAHEPLLVVIGHRGARRRSSEGSRARRRLAVLGGGAIACGAAAVALAPPAAIAVAAGSLVPVAAVAGLAWRRAEHTWFGEVIAAIALTGASAPVLVASGAAPRSALAIWLGWAAGFAASVVAVHRVLARHKRPASWIARRSRIAGGGDPDGSAGGAGGLPRGIDRALAVGLGALAAAAIATAARSPASLLAAPLVSIAALLVIAPPPASRLRAVGIAIALAAAASGLLALCALHGPPHGGRAGLVGNVQEIGPCHR